MAEPLSDEDRAILDDALTVVSAVKVLRQDVRELIHAVNTLVGLLSEERVLTREALDRFAERMAPVHDLSPTIVLTSTGVLAASNQMVRDVVDQAVEQLGTRLQQAVHPAPEDSP